ncbi:MAG: hypothetical protein M1269_12930 [Chloroflexi bacterium]|nr:hypothetical protein [Chloroflexota bacterium]
MGRYPFDYMDGKHPGVPDDKKIEAGVLQVAVEFTRIWLSNPNTKVDNAEQVLKFLDGLYQGLISE